MKKSLGLALTAATVVLLAACLPRLVRACAQPGWELIFINTLHPDLPIGPYTQGNLGVIQRTYGTIYLYVAYRNLVGRPIQPSEQEALWHGDERIISPQSMTRPKRVVMPPSSIEVRGADPGPAEAPAPAPATQEGDQWPEYYNQIDIHENGMEFYSQFLNCPQDAFREADKTLKLRTQQYGETSPIVQDWKEAQRKVFGNCDMMGTIPDDLPPTAPAIARADRRYQIAAAHFYARDYDEAVSDLRAIAQDPSSPWSTIAPYLVARALTRKATVIDKTEPDLATLAQAETQVESVLANPRLAQYHHAAQHLRGFIEFRLHPRERLEELAANLMKVPNDPELAQDTIDFKRLFNGAGGMGFWNEPHPSGSDVNTKPVEARAKSDLLDWMLTLSPQSTGAYSHSLERWEATHSTPWLVAALTTAEASSPHVPDLLAAARRVPPSSPAYCSVTFHSLRLLLMQGKEDEVRERLAHVRIRHLGALPPDHVTPPSTVNLFLAMRFALAQNLNELLENAPRRPATISDDFSREQLPETDWAVVPPSVDTAAPRFDDDSLVVLNRFLPVAVLAEAAGSHKLPEKLRHQIALAAWTRAVLLENTGVAHALAPDVESLVPKLKASVQAYHSAATPEERRFAAALAMLRFPGLSPFITTVERTTPIDEIRGSGESWWDPGAPPGAYPGFFTSSDSLLLGQLYPGGRVKPPTFLTDKDREEAAQESRQLVDLGPAPNYLTKEAVAWAKTHPNDPRAPEALALAVRSTRWGSKDEKTGQLSKAAFDLLHRRYPKSTWAQQTKYWFK